MKNKALFMAPMSTWSSNPDLTISEPELRYYQRRAKNVDYVITGAAFTVRQQQAFPNQIYAGSDEYLGSLAVLAQSIQRGGAGAILQLHSPGRMVAAELQTDPTMQVVSASAVRPERDGYHTPRALTVAEIDKIVQSYYNVVLRAIKAGFDGVEIHGANTFLPQQFVSPLTNQRTDEYGQDRLLFVRQLVAAIQNARRDARMSDFILGYRFSPEEKDEGGLRLEHTFGLLDYLCASELDYLHVSLERFDRTSYFDDTLIAPLLIDHIRQRKPLIGVGQINTRADIERAYALGYDHLALGRTLIINPDWQDTETPLLEMTAETLPSDIPPNMREKLLKFFA